MTAPFWRGKTVLVAGATGFLGGWLVRRLLEYGAHVVTLVRLDKPDSQFFMDTLDTRVSVERRQCSRRARDSTHLRATPNRLLFSCRVRCGCQSRPRGAVGVFQILGPSTWQILEFLRNNRPHCISVISSTDKVYGTQPMPYREDMPLKPLHPYETAKATQDYAAQSYGKFFNLPVAITRCGNYFGGHDFNFTRLIPGVVRSIMRGEAPVLRSNGRFTRDFLYIEDAVDVQLLLGQCLSENPTLYGEAFNFSYGERLEVVDIVHRICRLLDAPFEPVVNADVIVEIPHIELSSEKAKRLLNWRPSHGFMQGLQRTVHWYRDYFAHEEDCVNQSAH